MRRLLCAALTLALVGSLAWAGPARVRDERAVVVGGVSETWRLVWTGPVKETCPADEVVTSITCPCWGLAYGEAGQLSLVRFRAAREVDRLELGSLFGKYDGPNDAAPGSAYLQRWPLKDGDLERQERGDPRLLGEIRQRPAPGVIEPADYNGDGQATEFLIQVGTLPCGKLQFAAVGVTKANPRLHALGSMAHPKHALVMPRHAWEALLKGPNPAPLLIWQCDDHGSGVRSMLTVSAKDGVIRAVDRDYSCASGDGPPNRLVQTTEW